MADLRFHHIRPSRARAVSFMLCVLLLLVSGTRTSAQTLCGVAQTTPIPVENEAGVGILRAALNCTGGGEVEVLWSGYVPVTAPFTVAEGVVLSVTGEDALAEVHGDGFQTNGTRLFEVFPSGGLTLSGLKLSGGSADAGGAVFSRSASVTLDNCVFEGNVATGGNGGAVLAEGGELTIVGGEFLANNATRYGGAVHAASNSLKVRGGSRFEGNSGVGGGGVFCGIGEAGSDKQASVCSITDAEFVSNSAARDSQGSVPDFSNLDGGGAAMFLAASAEVIDSTFSENHARLSGGALHGGLDSNVLVNGCRFGNNTSGKYGGAITAASMTLGGGTQLTNNKAEEDGGAVLGWDANGAIVFNDVVCTENSAELEGGCFYGVGAGIINHGTVMIDNAGDSGGAIFADDGSDISVSGGNFSGGSSTRGGFLFADFNTRVTISGGVIEDNVATINGGAIYCNGDEASNVSIEGGTFRHNKALESGGAIALWGATTLVSIAGGTFEDNEATNYGGFVLVEGEARFTCAGATIKGNSAGDQGGGIYAQDATSVSSSCNLIANESPQGAGIYLTGVKSATFENHDVQNNLALGGSVVYVSASHVVARGVVFKSSVGLEEYSIERAVQTDANTTLRAEECVFDGWLGDTIIFNTNSATGSLVLDSCDFSRSSATMPVISPNSNAEIRNAVISSHTFDNGITGALNGSLALVDRALDCSDSNVCGIGACVDTTLGVLCECLEDGQCLDDGGELFLFIGRSPATETFDPDPVTFELVVATGNGTTFTIWDLGFESEELNLDIVPSGGALPPGSNITVAVTGTPAKQDVGGKLSIKFTLRSVGNARHASTTITSLEVTTTFYLCPANEYASPQIDDANRVSCTTCDTIEGEEGVDCMDPGPTLASLPIRPGYWRSSQSSSVVLECLHPEACKGATEVSGSDDYCEDGYMGPYCAVCMDGYGSGVSNTCQHCDDTTVHVHIAMGALCAVVVISLLLPAVVYLIGGLGAIDIFRRSIARTRSVRSMTPIVPDQTPFEPSAGMDPVHTTASLVNSWTSKDKRRGGECGTKGPKAFSNNYSEPDGLARARAGLCGDDVGAVVKVPNVTSGRDPKHAVVSASRAARRNAVPKITVGGPHERREVYTEATNGGTSTCCAFGDKVKRSVSRLPLDKFKILVVVWQILAGLSSITGVEFPASYSRFLSWISVVNLDIGDLFSASCVLPSLTFYARLLASTLSPLLLMAVLVLTYRMAKRRAGLGRAGVIARRDAWSRHVAAGLLLTFLVFTSVSTVVFETFACDDGVVDGESYLRVDYSISCKSKLHLFFQIYAGLMILVYPIGIPALYAAILWVNRELLNPRVPAGSDVVNEAGTGADSKGRDGIPSLSFRTKQEDHTQSDRPSRKWHELDELVKSRTNHPDLVPSMFLWKDFAPALYYYEVIECGRRMILTGVLIFIAPRTASQAAVSCLFAFVSIMGFELLRPHTDPTNSWLYRLGCVVIFLSNFLALLIKVDVGEDGNRELFGGVLVAVNVLLVIAVVTSSWFTVQQSVDDSRGE